jgi:predicted house-cleaning NTP pyrophosphatase (Maf/HAM1 superfamily)
VFLEEIRGNIANVAGYSLAEIPKILAELQET